MNIFRLVYTLLIVSIVTAEWTNVDCTDKTVVKALAFAEKDINASLPESVTYNIDHPITCKIDKSEKATKYGLSIYGLDKKRSYYIHNAILDFSISGDFKMESKVLVATKTYAEGSKYPWEGLLY